MVAVKTTFDGQTIQVPAQLRGAGPGEVLIVYDERKLPVEASGRGSIWDCFGKAERQRTAEDIEQQVRNERESWGSP
jgi:hypothetical protein